MELLSMLEFDLSHTSICKGPDEQFFRTPVVRIHHYSCIGFQATLHEGAEVQVS